MLSNLDKKIILKLDDGVRQSASHIARDLNVSKQLVSYRLNRMEKKDIILKHLTVIDADRLGYSYYNLYLKMQNLSGEKEEEFINFLKSHTSALWIVRTVGNYGFIVALVAKSTLEFNQYFREIIKAYGEYIEDNDLFIVMDAFKLQYRYLSDEVQVPKSHYIGKKEVLDLKKDELMILKMLDEDGKMPITNIANKLGVTAPVVSYKIKNLVKLGLIQGFRPLLNPMALGYQWYIISFKLNNYSEQEEKELLMYLKENKQVVYLTRGLGAFNLVLDVHVKDVIEMDKLLNDIRNNFNRMIKNYTSLLIVDNPKTSFFPAEALTGKE